MSRLPTTYPAGRCSNANCRTDIPPMSGVGDLEDGDTWCDSIVNWGGRVKQEFDIDLQEWCNPGWPAGVNAAASSVKPCVDLGKAWGVCSERPRLPTMGLEYDAESLDLLQLMSVPDVIAEHPGCGKSPLVFRENRAGRFGGALFAQVKVLKSFSAVIAQNRDTRVLTFTKLSTGL